jgi:hypothetical protein
MRLATLLALALAALPALAIAQGASEYQKPPHINADEIAISFLEGRYISPVICKRKDGSQVEVNDSIQLKASPEQGGGNSLKATFFGIQVTDADYCYSSIERRVLDRRGFLHLHFRTRNRPDYGVADFRRMAKAGPLVYNAHRGELLLREIGGDAGAQAPRVLAFDGGDSRLVVEGIPDGSDGAKLLTQFFAKHPPQEGINRRYFTFRFFAKDGSEFTFYAIEDDRRWK